MTTRTELEEILVAQRARRSRVNPLPPLKRGRGMLGVLAVILILSASGLALVFMESVSSPEMIAIASLSPSVSPSKAATATFTATPANMQVCTDIPYGRLHVRFTAGEGSEVRGYLAEGEIVTFDSGSEVIKGELWQRVSSPVAGWVNARYLCGVE